MEAWIGVGIGVTIVNAVIWAYLASPFWPDSARRARELEAKTATRRAPQPEVPVALPSALSMGDGARLHRT